MVHVTNLTSPGVSVQPYDEDDDGEGVAEVDDAFESALEPRHGEGGGTS
jgi:hypothetical protein